MSRRPGLPNPLPVTEGTQPRSCRQRGMCRVCGFRRRVVQPGEIVTSFELYSARAAHNDFVGYRLPDRDAYEARDPYVLDRRWAEPDLCAACHSEREPTRAQRFEIDRIRAIKGPVRVSPDIAFRLRVTLLSHGAAGGDGLRPILPPTLTLDAAGRIIDSTGAPRRLPSAARDVARAAERLSGNRGVL